MKICYSTKKKNTSLGQNTRYYLQCSALGQYTAYAPSMDMAPLS